MVTSPPLLTPRRTSGIGVKALVVWMIVAIVSVGALAYFDQRREARAALDDFADDQAWLADALSRALEERLQRTERELRTAGTGLTRGSIAVGDANVSAGDRPASAGDGAFAFDIVTNADAKPLHARVRLAAILASVRSFERANEVRVFVGPPDRSALLATDGSTVRLDAIQRALDGGARSATVDRDVATDLGLPPRIAMAGLAKVDGGALGKWNVAVVATAQSERDREDRARARLLLAVSVAAGLVITFGGLAVRIRAKERDLEHALALGALEAERDEKLGHADKIATMGALAMGIAHEVSTPLGVILARAEQIARRSKDDERTRNGAEAIVAETERIHEVIRGFLGLVRGNAARLERARPTDLAESAVALVSHRFAKAGVALQTDLEDTAEVDCDRRLFEQALVNLLLNAADACSEGGVVSLDLRTDGERVAFIVTDDGEGLPPSSDERLLEPFFTTKKEGTGLGLAIAAELVKHHRGTLTVKPRDDGRGARAVVELPAAPPERPDA